VENKLNVQVKAAQEFAKASLLALSDGGKLQVESVIAGVSRMAGTYYFRSFNFQVPDLQPGQAVLSDIANQKGPELMNIARAILGQLGVKLDDAAIRAEMGNKASKNKPALDFKTTQLRLEEAFAPIKANHGLSDAEAGQAAAMAAATLIRDFQKSLSANIGFVIAVYGFVEGTKTAPYPMTKS
jgi:hypothetical protein